MIDIKNDFKMKLFVTISYLVMVLVNLAASLGIINQRTMEEVFFLYQNLLTPNTFILFIWSIIYLFLALFVIFQWTSKEVLLFSKKKMDFLRILFIISCFLNIGWIVLWHYLQIDLSMLVLYMLVVNIYFIKRLLKHYSFHSLKEKIIAQTGFMIYFSWLLVLLLNNILSFFVYENWLFYQKYKVIITLLFLLLSTFFTLYNVIEYTDYTGGLTVIVVYIEVLSTHIEKQGFDYHYPIVIYMLVCCIVSLIAMMGYLYIQGKNYLSTDEKQPEKE